MKFSLKKKIAAAATVVVIMGGATAAFAFWTTSGSGSGTGTVAASNGTLALSAAFPTAGLYPGGSVVVTYTANNTNASDLQVGTVHAVVSTSDPVNCLASDFSIANVAENQTIPNGTSAVLANTTNLVMANSALNQDGCKSAIITLTLTTV